MERASAAAEAQYDLGLVIQRADHERASAQIAAAILPDYGYTPAHIQAICGMIMATRLIQAPHTLLEQIVADADLDVLGRLDFVTRNQDLHAELAAFEGAVDDCDWYRVQLAFLRDHRYWTASARRLCEEQKQRNIAPLAPPGDLPALVRAALRHGGMVARPTRRRFMLRRPQAS